ncbi:glutamate receptor 3.2-like protein, partial [Tanacetum coccineum]
MVGAFEIVDESLKGAYDEESMGKALRLLPVVVPKSDIINIGYIVPLQTVNGRVSNIAMKAAVDDVNSDPRILPGRQLKLSAHDTNFTGFYGILG